MDYDGNTSFAHLFDIAQFHSNTTPTRDRLLCLTEIWIRVELSGGARSYNKVNLKQTHLLTSISVKWAILAPNGQEKGALKASQLRRWGVNIFIDVLMMS